jgi:hypothetical protein
LGAAGIHYIEVEDEEHWHIIVKEVKESLSYQF